MPGTAVLSPTATLPSKEEGEALIRRFIPEGGRVEIGTSPYSLPDILTAWSAYCNSGQEVIPLVCGWSSINRFHGDFLRKMVIKEDVPGSPVYYDPTESQRMRWAEFFNAIGWVADAE